MMGITDRFHNRDSKNCSQVKAPLGSGQTIVLQYVVPEDAEEGIVISRVIAFSDNGQRLEVATPLRITGEDEE
ncbi:hypothetical protein AAXB25_19930 [Paenibacillus lautus]|uniref:hypothetical protein n=1 Tax=Paenibacillus lautus TaxID=1401 RepID=UPI003D2B9729